jgi:NTE family protein
MGGVALVLSGGGAKAAAHIGVWRALTERGIAPVQVVATSMGAVVGAALCAGVGPDELLERLAAMGPKGVVRSRTAPIRGLFARGLLRAEPFRAAVAALVPARSFRDLRVPLTVTAADLDRGVTVRFGAGGEDAPLVDVLCATCALPLYYPPVVIAGRRLADGGLRGPLPLGAVSVAGVERVIAVDVGPGFDAAAPAPGTRPLPAMLQAHDEAIGVLMANATESALALWRATPGLPPLSYLRPTLERAATFRVDRVRGYAEAGYAAIMAVS